MMIALGVLALIVAWSVLSADDSGDASLLKGAPILEGTGPSPGARIGTARAWWPWRARLTLIGLIVLAVVLVWQAGWDAFLAVPVIVVGHSIGLVVAGADVGLTARRVWLSLAWVSVARTCGLSVNRDRRLVRAANGREGTVSVEEVPALTRGRRVAAGIMQWRIIPARGQTLGDIIDRTEAVRTALRAASVTVQPDHRGRGLGVLTVSWSDPPAPTIGGDKSSAPPMPAPWAPSRPSTSRPALVDAAVDSNGAAVTWPLLAGGSSPHVLIAGTTGAGKSSWVDAILHSLAPHDHVAIVMIDPALVTAGRWEPRLSASASFPGERDALLHWLDQEMRRRFVKLRAGGITAITHGTAETPVIVLVVDEFADMTKDQKAILETLTQMARKIGMVVIAATQHPSAKTIPTETRGQFGKAIALRMIEVEAAKATLGGNGTRAGHDPMQIGEDLPGLAVVVGVGHPRMARSRFATDAQVVARAKDTAGKRVDLAGLAAAIERSGGAEGWAA